MILCFFSLYKNVHSDGCYLSVKENSSPAPPVILTWQYFGSSQERGAYNKHKNDDTFTSERKVRYMNVFAKPMTIKVARLDFFGGIPPKFKH